MTVYDEYIYYGPYTRKDGRQHIVLVKHNDNGEIVETRTVSYPKFLVEKHINRYLDKSETVDHIDGNFNNNACLTYELYLVLYTRKVILTRNKLRLVNV